MRREVTLSEISDGKLYGLNDMVKAGCDGCRDCFSCCCDMGTSIVLDPLDMHRLARGLGESPAGLLEKYLELNVVDGIVQPNLPMAGASERCRFLNEEGRCSIHPFRPGICRLFPLGRYYDGSGGFQYFLQVHECRKEARTKVKVRKWIDTPEPSRYDAYIGEWHGFLVSLQEKLARENPAGEKRAGEQANAVSLYILKTFYLTPYETEDFYGEFEKRLAQGKAWRDGL